jgi:hypothetical protein
MLHAPTTAFHKKPTSSLRRNVFYSRRFSQGLSHGANAGGTCLFVCALRIGIIIVQDPSGRSGTAIFSND